MPVRSHARRLLPLIRVRDSFTAASTLENNMLMNDAKPRTRRAAIRSKKASRLPTPAERAAIERAFARLLSGVSAATLADLLAPRDEGRVH
jgi:hypothetical protein